MRTTTNSACIAGLSLLFGCDQVSLTTQLSSIFEAAVSPTTTLCLGYERVVFNCVIENSKKTASVCASPDLEGVSRHIVYRYGRPDHVELVYPETKAGSFSKFFCSVYTRPLVTRQSLRFLNKDYAYVIAVENNAEEDSPSYTAMISVSGPNNLELQCEVDGLAGVDVNVQDVLPCDPEGGLAEYSLAESK